MYEFQVYGIEQVLFTKKRRCYLLKNCMSCLQKNIEIVCGFYKIHRIQIKFVI